MWVRQGRLICMLLYIIAIVLFTSFIQGDEMVKGIQIGDHEIKLVNFANDTTIFLWEITCLNTIQAILKLYENAKIN